MLPWGSLVHYSPAPFLVVEEKSLASEKLLSQVRMRGRDLNYQKPLVPISPTSPSCWCVAWPGPIDPWSVALDDESLPVLQAVGRSGYAMTLNKRACDASSLPLLDHPLHDLRCSAPKTLSRPFGSNGGWGRPTCPRSACWTLMVTLPTP